MNPNALVRCIDLVVRNLTTFFAAALLICPPLVQAGSFERIRLPSGAQLETYVHFERARFDPQRVLVVLAPGSQTRDAVDLGLSPLRQRLEASGWTLVAPVSPLPGRPITGPVILALLDAVQKRLEVRFGPVALFGISNGGIAALQAAVADASQFSSVTVAPGMVLEAGSEAELVKLPVTLVVGANDRAWREKVEGLASRLREAGGRAELVVIPDAGHMAALDIKAELIEQWVSKR